MKIQIPTEYELDYEDEQRIDIDAKLKSWKRRVWFYIYLSWLTGAIFGFSLAMCFLKWGWIK